MPFEADARGTPQAAQMSVQDIENHLEVLRVWALPATYRSHPNIAQKSQMQTEMKILQVRAIRSAAIAITLELTLHRWSSRCKKTRSRSGRRSWMSAAVTVFYHPSLVFHPLRPPLRPPRDLLRAAPMHLFSLLHPHAHCFLLAITMSNKTVLSRRISKLSRLIQSIQSSLLKWGPFMSVLDQS